MKNILVIMLVLGVACSASRPDTGDLGSFMPGDLGGAEGDVVLQDLGAVDAMCRGTIIGGNEDLSVVGQLYLMSWDNLFPGDHTGDVNVKLFDMCGEEFFSFDVLPWGSFAFHLPMDEEGYDGYFEFPHRPDFVAEEEWTLGGHPLVREFDKPFFGHYIHVNLRIFDPAIMTFSTSILQQEDDKGYVQGTIYDWFDYHTLADVVVTSSSGKVWYVSEANLPDATLEMSQHKGIFLIANAEPGLVKIDLALPNGNTVSKTILTWPMKGAVDGQPDRLLATSVGYPVPPELLL